MIFSNLLLSNLPLQSMDPQESTSKPSSSLRIELDVPSADTFSTVSSGYNLRPSGSVSSFVSSFTATKKKFYPEDLSDLFFSGSSEEAASIYAICIQECSSDKNELLVRLQAAIGIKHVLFTYATHGTLALMIFLNRDLIWYTSGMCIIFQNFDEGRIRFPPTYKFDLNSDVYDSSEKQRVPSYTDRILFMSKKKGNLICLDYNSINTIRSSDHRPVFALFSLVLRPGSDNIALAAGAFNREVYIAGMLKKV
ncbi:putative type IV inositol 5-phosphatase [Schistosoma mansoni]|uniref:putative type IV inositol 5-phosphatase n=1 Tax=Schistosoma mansoni TaxID=6183 RepID=UPI00022DC202|nr:putative type IV inositol 5-phosphatase [Schistosoma mansoni]|eukprot:XP_018650134.1 putative type IV inositol 5-phosphatase [Schistosoma mansoni]